MTLRRGISRALRRVASAVAPDREGRRAFEAAGGGRRWDGFAALADPERAAMAARGPARARAAALAANNPLAARVVEVWAANLVGAGGWQAQSRHPDRATRRRLNREFERLIRPIMPGLARALVRDGESFTRVVADPSMAGETRLTPLPADQIDASITRDLGNGARIVAGIELDGEDRVTAYHVLPAPPGAPFGPVGAAIRVPAEEILHVFDPAYPGQVRGITWLAPVLLKLRDYDETSDAQLMALKTQSMITGFVRDIEGGTGGFSGTRDGAALDVTLEPGAMRLLPPGADVTFSQPGRGLAESVGFSRQQLREIAAGAGLTYDQLSGDLSETNYSSARVALLEFRRRAEMLQRTLIEGRFLAPLWQRRVDLMLLAGEIDPAEAEAHRDVRHIAPGWQWVDPAREVSAWRDAVEAGFASRAEVAAGRGRDIEDLDRERAADRAPQAAGGAA